MRNFVRSTALAALLLAALPAAQAATQNYLFNGALDSGIFNGQTFSGSFSFDDAALTGFDTEWLNVDSLSMSFLGNSYSLADADGAVEVSYFNGDFVGLSYTVSVGDPQFSFIPGSFALNESFVAYDTTQGLSGAGSINFAPVPEPESYAMLLAGLGLIGCLARRRAKML